MAESLGEKTEQPTPKKLEEAEKKGQVAISQDLSSAILLLFAVGFFWLYGKLLGEFTLKSTSKQFLEATTFKSELSQEIVFSAFGEGLLSFFMILMPLFVVLVVFVFSIKYFQIGSVFATENIKPTLSRINFVDGLMNLFFNPKTYIEIFLIIFKICAIAIVIFTSLWSAQNDILNLVSKSLDISILFMFNLVIGIGFKLAIFFLLLGIADYVIQQYLLRRNLRMSKEELRQEYKETEINPQIKLQRSTDQKENLNEALMTGVKQASVIISSSSNVAVALKYDRNINDAPIITAKGANLRATQICELAKKLNIPITIDFALTTLLYKLEVNDVIPEKLFDPVAKVLHWAHKITEEKSAK